MKIVLGILAAALTLQSAALAQTTLTLSPVDTKGPTGSATLGQQSGNLVIGLNLPEGYRPARAAIFSGTCSGNSSSTVTPNDPIALNVNAVGGTANTTLPLTVRQLTSRPHVIVVLGTPALCADIKA